MADEIIRKSPLSSRLGAFVAHLREHRMLLSILRWAIALAVIAYIVVTLRDLGWTTVWLALPGHWTFYALVALLFMVQPVADLVIYRRLWRIGPPLGLTAMLRKRFFNSLVIDYSGEGWLFTWARRHMPGQDAFILHTIKDSNILSASAALLVLIVLVVCLMAAVPGPSFIPTYYVVSIGALCAISVLPIMGYMIVRKRMTVLPASDLIFVFAIHLIRSVLNNGLAVVIWSQGLPGAPLLALLELLALRLLVSRLPFLGNRDIVFIGTGLGLAEAIDLPQAGIAAVLLATLTLEQLLNLICVGIPLLIGTLRDLVRRRQAAAQIK